MGRRLATVAAAIAMLTTSATITASAAEPTSTTASPPSIQAVMPANTWWGVRGGRTTSEYNEYFPGYAFGCNGDQRHKGVDVGAPTGNRIHAWGTGRVVGRGFDPGGYNRWIQVYFPRIDMSMTLGHLLNGSEMTVGTTFQVGDLWGRIGTVEDGLNHSHVHYRAGWGNHGDNPIGPCNDVDPYIVWDALDVPF